MSSLLQSIEASLEHVRSLLSIKSGAEKQKLILKRINIDAVKDMVVLLGTFQEVMKLIPTGDRPTLQMVYVGINKISIHLRGSDVDSNGETILIDDHHDGKNTPKRRETVKVNFIFRNKFFSSTTSTAFGNNV